jgi:hypothetical protein
MAKALTPGIFYTNTSALSTNFYAEFGTKLCFFGLLREDLKLLLARMTSFGPVLIGFVDSIGLSGGRWKHGRPDQLYHGLDRPKFILFTGPPVGSALRIVIQFEYPELRAS